MFFQNGSLSWWFTRIESNVNIHPNNTSYISGIYCQLGDYMVPIPPIKGTRKLHSSQIVCHEFLHTEISLQDLPGLLQRKIILQGHGSHRIITSNLSNVKGNHFPKNDPYIPIPSMGRTVYLPTWKPETSTKCRSIYKIHGCYGWHEPNEILIASFRDPYIGSW